MENNYSFYRVSNNNELSILKNEWLATLSNPQDGMWDIFRDNGIHWKIVSDKEIIGYAIINEDDELLQFYISSRFISKGEIIFKSFIDKVKVKTGIIGTNNLIFLSIALNFVKDLKVNTYLFRANYKVNIDEKEGVLKACKKEDIDRIVNFYNYSMGAPKEWLMGYIGNLINKTEIFSLENNSEIIGACEVRNSNSAPSFADIGMVVSPDFRRKGYGTYLLNLAKNIAIEKGKTPICSCEKDNVGSVKSIQNCGFVSNYQLLTIDFK